LKFCIIIIAVIVFALVYLSYFLSIFIISNKYIKDVVRLVD